MPTCSLNEIDAYGRRAARGAGMTWGLADEAGRAARWLSEQNLAGLSLLASLLEHNDGCDYASIAPVTDNGPWHAAGGWLCPVCTGAALSDRAATLALRTPLQLAATTAPLLLVPFVAQATQLAKSAFELGWLDASVRVQGSTMQVHADDRDQLHAMQVDAVTITRCRPLASQATATRAAVTVSDAVWLQLGALARRTYVPSSELSRTRGAGAGTSDND